MQKRLIVYFILLNILLSIFIPNISTAEEAPWWNENWSFRQEITIPIDTSDEYTKFQPIDIPLSFNNTCWAKKEDEHSIRVIYQNEERLIELESQIYDLKYENNEYISSCNLVFLIPDQANGNEKYFVYYDDEEKSAPDYQKRIEIEESYYKYEPIQGIGFESSYFKITEGEEIIYAVNKEGTVLGDKISQQVTRLKKGAKDILPHNSDQITEFAFRYWWKIDEEWCGISSKEKFISKQLFVDGNLMVKFGIVSESENGHLRSTVIYKYYHCPTEEKRLYTSVRHEVIDYPLTRGDEIDVAYITLTCGGIKSSVIEELNFGEIPPYLHFYSDEDRVKSYNFDQYPDYSNWQPIIHKNDDFDLGSSAWLSVDNGETGKAHGIIFNSTNILKSGTDERDGISLQLYEAKGFQYPGLEALSAELYIMRNAFEPGEPNDEILPENYVIEFEAEYFTTENGGYPTVEKEASVYQKLIRNQPEIDDVVDDEEDVEKYNLTVIPHLPRSILFKLRLSTLLLRGAQITAGLFDSEELIGYGTPHRIPITEEVKIDFKNISFFRKMVFSNIPSGKYVVKIWLENAILSDDQEFIGYKIVELNEDKKVRIFCKHQGKIRISVKNQDDDGIENVQFYLLDEGSIIEKGKSDSNGQTILKAPCGLTNSYSLNTTYKGFFIDEQNLRLGRIRQIIPKRVSLNFDTHDLMININDSEGNAPSFDVDLSITSNEMQIPEVIKPNLTNDGTYIFKDLYPANYILKINYELFEIKEKIPIPDKSLFEINLYDLTAIIKDDWNLPPEAPLDVSLTSKDLEKTVILNPKKLSSERYLFSNIYPGNYTIKVSYKSYKREESIRIPSGNDGNTNIVFSALFNITTKVLDSRGNPLKDAKVIFTRGDKEIEGISNSNGNVLFSIPPGVYNSTIYSNEEFIAQRKVDVLYDKDYSVVTTNEPIYPFIAIALALILLAFSAIFAYKKKNIIFFLKICAIVIAVIAIVSPWWTVQGNLPNSHLETSTKLYIIPTEMVTIITNNNLTAGELTVLDETFEFVVSILPYAIIFGFIILLAPDIFKRFKKGKFLFILLFLALIIFAGSIVGFSYAMSEMANVTVGSFIGSGNLDVSIPGENTYETMSCSWGPGISFYIFLGSIILLLIVILLNIKNRRYQIEK